MGQSQSDSLPGGSISQDTQSHLEKRFFVSPHPVYRNNPEFKLLHEKLTNKKYILRVITVSDDSQRTRLEDAIFKKIASRNDYLPKLQHYIFEEYKGYCGKAIKCYLFFKLGEFTIFREEILKQANHRAPFTEQELLKGVENLMYGLLWLRFFKEPHQNINTLNIYCSEGSFYLTDPLIAPVNNENPERYISPQKQRKVQDIIEEYDPYVSDVYSIAMCMLQALKFGHMQRIYKKNGKVNSVLLIEEINKIRYEKLKELLQRLLISSNNTEYREHYLESFSKKHSGSVVSSQIMSDKTQRIHAIGGKRISAKTNQQEQHFITTNEVNQFPFKKDKSLSRMQPLEPEFRHIQRVQTVYKMASAAHQKPAFSYKPAQTSWNPQSSYQPIDKSMNTLSSYQAYHPPQTLPAFSSSSNTAGFNINYSKMPLRNNSMERLIPNMNSLANSFKVDAPVTNYIPLSHEFQNKKSDMIQISRKLEYPKENNDKKLYDNIQTYSHYVPPKPPALSIFSQRRDVDHSSSYTSRFRPMPEPIKKIDSSPTHLAEHSFPKRISSLKKYSEDKKYQKFLEDHDSIKKCLKQGWSSQKKQVKAEVQMNGACSTKKDEESLQVQRVRGSNEKINDSGSKSKLNQSLEKKEKDEKIHNSSTKKEMSGTKKQEDRSPHKSASNKKQNNSKNAQINENKQQKNPGQQSGQKRTQRSPPVSDRKNMTLEGSHSVQGSALFEHILDKNINHLEEGISKAIQKSIKCLADPDLSNQNSGSKIKEDQSYQPSDSIGPLQNLPLMTSEVVVDESQDSRVVSQIIQGKVSEGFEINIPYANDEHLNSVNSSMNVQQESEQLDQIPRSPMTPSRPYNPNHRHRHERTIPEEDALEEESVEDGVSPHKQVGEYKEEEYPNGGKYCGFISKQQRNGQGTFYYKDGGYYVGQWKDNAMNGYGKLYYDNGILAYEGQWYRDQFHGRGKVYNDNSTDLLAGFDYKTFDDYELYWKYYDGDLSHDVKEGFGKLMLSNNEFYVGKFVNDLPDGQGYFHTAKRVVHGIWNQGRLVKEI